jgi:uncharacterized protein
MVSKKARIVSTLMVAMIGGIVFQVLHIPLPWLLGPLLAVVIGNIIYHNQLEYSGYLKNSGLIFLSFVLGTSFTLDSVVQVYQHLPLMLAITFATVLFSIFIAVVIALVGHLNIKDAILGSIPGGLSNMVALSEEIKGTDMTTVTTFQLVRLLSVITIVPILANILADDSASNIVEVFQRGEKDPKISVAIDTFLFLFIVPLATWISIKVKVPTAIIIGPIVSTAILVVMGFKAPIFPPIILNAAQLLVGAHIGMLMVLKDSRNLQKILWMSMLLSVSIIGFSVLIGYVMPKLMDVTPLTGMLGAAPGGVAEMGVTAAQLHADISIVTAYQLFRLFFILLIVPFTLRILLNKIPEKKHG